MKELIWDPEMTTVFCPPSSSSGPDEDISIRVLKNSQAYLTLKMPYTRRIGRRVKWTFDEPSLVQFTREGIGVDQCLLGPYQDGEAEWRIVDACPTCGTEGKASARWAMVSGF
jgi:hypothetical protein